MREEADVAVIHTVPERLEAVLGAGFPTAHFAVGAGRLAVEGGHVLESVGHGEGEVDGRFGDCETDSGGAFACCMTGC